MSNKTKAGITKENSFALLLDALDDEQSNRVLNDLLNELPEPAEMEWPQIGNPALWGAHNKKSLPPEIAALVLTEIQRWLSALKTKGPDEVMRLYAAHGVPPICFATLLAHYARKRTAEAKAEAARRAGALRHKADAQLRNWVCSEWSRTRSRYKSRAAGALHFFDVLQHESHEHYREYPPTIRTLESWLSQCEKKIS